MFYCHCVNKEQKKHTKASAKHYHNYGELPDLLNGDTRE